MVDAAVGPRGDVAGRRERRALARDPFAVAVAAAAGHRLDRAPAVLGAALGAVAEVHRLPDRIVGVVNVEEEAADALAAGVPCRHIGAPVEHHGDLLARAVGDEDRAVAEVSKARIEAARDGVVTVIDVGDPHRDGLAALDLTPISVLAVPLKVERLIRRRAKDLGDAPPGDLDRELDALEIGGGCSVGDGDGQEATASLEPGRAQALVAQRVGRSRERDTLAQDLVLDPDDRSALLAAVVVLRPLALGRLLRPFLAVVATRPVGVPWAEVRHGHAPELLSSAVDGAELRELLRGDPERRERRRGVGHSVAGDIHAGDPAGDGDHGDDPPIAGALPAAHQRIVGAHRRLPARGEAEEVLDILNHRLAELDRHGACRKRLIHAVVDGVGIGGGRRQRRGHRLRSARPHGVLGGAHMERGERRCAAVRELHHRRRARRKEERRLPLAVEIGDDAAAREPALGRRGQRHRGHLGIARDHHHVRRRDPVGPGHVDAALDREQTALLILDGQAAAAVDDEIEEPVEAGLRGAELGVIEHGDDDAGHGRAAAIEHLPAQDRRAPPLDGARRDAGLDRARPRVEKEAGVEGRGGDGAIEGRREERRIRWAIEARHRAAGPHRSSAAAGARRSTGSACAPCCA